MENRTNSIARVFDRVCDVLSELGYLDGEEVTEAGTRLARIYGELDLLVAECLRSGLWESLTAPELAACVSALVYESRQKDDSPLRLPTGRVREVLAETTRLWGELEAVERDNKLDFLHEPDPGFAWVAYRWADGHSLDAVLRDADLSAGDFVRWVRQLLDLLSQIAAVAPHGTPVRAAAVSAIDALRRGVVAYSSVG